MKRYAYCGRFRLEILERTIFGVAPRGVSISDLHRAPFFHVLNPRVYCAYHCLFAEHAPSDSTVFCSLYAIKATVAVDY